jgi:hypothetical protein
MNAPVGPTAREIVESTPARSFLKEVCSYPYGSEFVEALQRNLEITQDVFAGDPSFFGRLKAKTRTNALSAISELWLAAHFIRNGWNTRRNEPEAGRKTSDFTVEVPSAPNPVTLNVEAKRAFGRPGAPLSEWDRPREWPSVPSTFSKSDFNTVLSRRRERARRQLRPSGRLVRGVRVLALDVTESHTYQRLLALDMQPHLPLTDFLMRGKPELLFGFAVGLNHAGLWYGRWLDPNEIRSA